MKIFTGLLICLLLLIKCRFNKTIELCNALNFPEKSATEGPFKSTVSIILSSLSLSSSFEKFGYKKHRNEFICLKKKLLLSFWIFSSRVVVQNERYEDWTATLIELKKIFIEYPERVLRYHQREGVHVPESWNSTSVQGNFLQVLNMALNGENRTQFRVELVLWLLCYLIF